MRRVDHRAHLGSTSRDTPSDDRSTANVGRQTKDRPVARQSFDCPLGVRGGRRTCTVERVGSSVKTARSISHERVLAFQRAKDEKRYVGRLVRDALTVGRGDVTSRSRLDAAHLFRFAVKISPELFICGAFLYINTRLNKRVWSASSIASIIFHTRSASGAEEEGSTRRDDCQAPAAGIGGHRPVPQVYGARAAVSGSVRAQLPAPPRRREVPQAEQRDEPDEDRTAHQAGEERGASAASVAALA